MHYVYADERTCLINILLNRILCVSRVVSPDSGGAPIWRTRATPPKSLIFLTHINTHACKHLAQGCWRVDNDETEPTSERAREKINWARSKRLLFVCLHLEQSVSLAGAHLYSFRSHQAHGPHGPRQLTNARANTFQ